MNYTEALEYIHSLGRFSHEAGLERITQLCYKLGSPQNCFPAIHIAGTNGKGSTATYIAEVFKSAGYKTGLYTSPYIIKFNERISVDGIYISDEELVSICEQVKAVGVECTEFEFITACAFEYFAQKKCDIVILETGLGGRFDATNVASKKRACVITKIGLDHCAVLGDTIQKITAEKCGIIRDCPLVTSPEQTKEALSVIKQYKEDVIIPQKDKLKKCKSGLTGNTFIYKGREYETSLIGEHQIENALCAIETIEASGYDISYDNIYAGIKNAFIPARLEKIDYDGKTFIIDGAHNPDAALRLAKFLENSKEKLGAVVGMMADKDYRGVISKILPMCNHCVAVKCADIPRALSAQQLSEEAKCFCECECASDFDDALNIALSMEEKCIVVFGSLYLASAIRKKLPEANEK